MEVGPTGAQFGSDPGDTGYAARFNGREIVRRVAEAHSGYLVIWARDGEYAYYNSRYMPRCPGLGDRDVLREAVEEGRRHNLPVIAYCNVQYGGYVEWQHPEYRMRDASGQALHRICYNSGYLDFMKRLTAEMIAYGIDGFHLDMVDQGFGPPYGCWCDHCRALFEKEYGRPPPGGVTWDEDWDRMLSFRYNSSARFERALREHIRAVHPGVTVDYNYHGSPPFSWEVGQRPVQHAHIGDFVTGETGVWGFSALGVSLNARFLAATGPGKIFQVAMQRGVRMYHDQTTRPLNDIRWELLTLLSHGARVTLVDKTAYDGWLDPVAYERIGLAFREALEKGQHFGHPLFQEVGIYYSSRSRDWYGRGEPARYQQAFLGAHKAFAYEHIPYGILLDENSTLERLRRFPVVCLPGVAILSEKEVELLHSYVQGGGNLLVTGISGLLGKRGEPLAESDLAGLIGARLVERLDSLDNHVRLPSTGGGDDTSRLHDGIRTGWPFLVKGPAVVYRPLEAIPRGELLRPHRTLRQLQGKEGTDWPMSAGEPAGPAVLLNRIGRGRVLTLACSPDFATASEHHIVEARRLLRNALRFLNPAPPVEVEAPASVEAVVTESRDQRKIRVHLLGYLSPPAATPARNRPYILPGLIEDAPIFRATIRVRRPFKKARAWKRSTLLKRGDDRIEVTVEDIHEVIVIDY